MEGLCDDDEITFCCRVNFCRGFCRFGRRRARSRKSPLERRGWYVIQDLGSDWVYVISGAYSAEASCVAKLPFEEDEEWYCEYLTQKPSWDR